MKGFAHTSISEFLSIAALAPALCLATCPVMTKLPEKSFLRVKEWAFPLDVEYATIEGNYTMTSKLWTINTVLVLTNPKGKVVAEAWQPFFFWDHTTLIKNCSDNSIFTYKYRSTSGLGATTVSWYDIMQGSTILANATKEVVSGNVQGKIEDVNGVVTMIMQVSKEYLFAVTSGQSFISEAEDPRLLLLFIGMELLWAYPTARFGPKWTWLMWILIYGSLFCCSCCMCMGCCWRLCGCEFKKRKVAPQKEEREPMIDGVDKGERQQKSFLACCAGSARTGAKQEMLKGGPPPKNR